MFQYFAYLFVLYDNTGIHDNTGMQSFPIPMQLFSCDSIFVLSCPSDRKPPLHPQITVEEKRFS